MKFWRKKLPGATEDFVAEFEEAFGRGRREDLGAVRPAPREFDQGGQRVEPADGVVNAWGC